jgi:chemotaxis methyl-accepting protein methylase
VVGRARAEDQPKEEAVTLTLPRDAIRPAWRAAVLAYRREYRATREDRFASEAAFEAFREVLPDMPEEQAKVEANHAIAYAATNHTEWFWKGLEPVAP